MLENTPQTIRYSQFIKIGLTIARAVHLELNQSAKIPSYFLQLDLGPNLSHEHQLLYKRDSYFSSAQLCYRHTIEEIQGRQLLCALNFPRKQIGKKMSDCLITGVQSPFGSLEEKRETTIYIKPSHPVLEGSRAGLLAEKIILKENARNLDWQEFLEADLRIGTILNLIKLKEGLTPKTHIAIFEMDFGEELGR